MVKSGGRMRRKKGRREDSDLKGERKEIECKEVLGEGYKRGGVGVFVNTDPPQY